MEAGRLASIPGLFSNPTPHLPPPSTCPDPGSPWQPRSQLRWLPSPQPHARLRFSLKNSAPPLVASSQSTRPPLLILVPRHLLRVVFPECQDLLCARGCVTCSRKPGPPPRSTPHPRAHLRSLSLSELVPLGGCSSHPGVLNAISPVKDLETERMNCAELYRQRVSRLSASDGNPTFCVQTGLTEPLVLIAG